MKDVVKKYSKKAFSIICTMTMIINILPVQNVNATNKANSQSNSEMLGNVMTKGDTSFDSDSIKNNDDTKWHWMSYPESRIVIHPKETADGRTPYDSSLNLNIGLFVKGIKEVKNFQTVEFKKEDNSENQLQNSKTTWYPYQYEASSNLNEGTVHMNEYFVDRNTLVRKFDVQNTTGKVILSSEKQNGTFTKQDNIVIHDANDYYIAYKINVLNNDGSIKSIVDPHVESEQWSAEINLADNQHFSISMTLGVKDVKGESLENTVSRSKEATDNKNFSQLLNAAKAFWDQKLAKVPAPTVWGIQGIDAKGVTPEQHRRSFYAAWTYQYQNIIEETPETGYNYKQVTLGMASMWGSGTPSAPNSCAWESFFDIQALAMVEPDIAWSAAEGFIQEIDENGILKGECLPSQKAHTVWICHSYKPNVEKLKELYPKLRSYLLWRGENPRWIYGGHNYEDEKDLSFITQWFSDVDYAIKICNEIGMESDIVMWEQLKEEMFVNMKQWFFSDPTGQLHWTYFTKTQEYYKHDRLSDVDNYIIGALSIEGLPQDMKNQLVDYYLKLHDVSKDLVGFDFYKYGDGCYIAYGLIEEGLKNKKLAGKGKEFTNAVLRNIVKTVEFSEESKPDSYDPSGVQPSTFTASAVIDYTYINNGVRMDQGQLSLWEVGNTKIDEDSVLDIKTSVLKTKRPILPKTVEIKNTDNQTINAFVSWEDYDESLVNKAGKFTIKGKIAGSDLIVNLEVNVYDQKVQYDPIEITTVAKQIPALPDKLLVKYTVDKKEYNATANVVWDQIKEEQIIGGEDIEVKGHFDFNGQEVTANIHVLGKLNIQTSTNKSYMNRYDTMELKVVDGNGESIHNVQWEIKDKGDRPIADMNALGKLLAIQQGEVTVVADIPEYNTKIEKSITILPSSSTTLAYGANAVVTSQADDARGGQQAVDGDENTMWRADKDGDRQSITLDLRKVCTIEGVSSLWFEETRPKKFSVSTSVDGKTWETVSVKNTLGNGKVSVTDIIVFDEVVDARYIKIEVLENGGYNVGIQELEVYGSIKDAQKMTDLEIVSETGSFEITNKGRKLQLSVSTTTSNADTRVEWEVTGENGKPTRLAQINENGLLTPLSDGVVIVKAKAMDGSGLVAAKEVTLTNQLLDNVALNQPNVTATTNAGEAYKAVDGDRGTRWGSDFGAPQTQELKVDFGEELTVNSVVLYCDSGAYPIDCEVQYWDGGKFVTLEVLKDNDSPNIRFDFAETKTVAIRVNSFKTTNKEWGFSVWEFEIYGVTSKTLLNNAYDIYKDVNEFEYKTKGWKEFETALSKVKELIDSTNVDEEPMTKAVNELHATFGALELRNDTIDLKDAIVKAEEIDRDSYTPKTVEKLEKVLEDAKKVYENRDSSKEDIEKAEKDLIDQMNQLVKKANKKNLKSMINEIKELNAKDYTKDSFKKLNDALIQAQKVLNDENATQEEVQQAYKELKSAYDSLVKVGENKPDVSVEPDDNHQVEDSNINNDSVKTSDSTMIIPSLIAVVLSGVFILKLKRRESFK